MSVHKATTIRVISSLQFPLATDLNKFQNNVPRDVTSIRFPPEMDKSKASPDNKGRVHE